jgi:hypothetical protein
MSTADPRTLVVTVLVEIVACIYGLARAAIRYGSEGPWC